MSLRGGGKGLLGPNVHHRHPGDPPSRPCRPPARGGTSCRTREPKRPTARMTKKKNVPSVTFVFCILLSVIPYPSLSRWRNQTDGRLTPNRSYAFRFPCIKRKSWPSVSEPLLPSSYFANMSSNCWGRKRPSVSNVPESDPCCAEQHLVSLVHQRMNRYIGMLCTQISSYLCLVDRVNVDSKQGIREP